MRGFRGSRAAQQFFGRHGNQHSSNHGGEHQSPQAQANASVVARLPEWMKTPETKAREAQDAKQQHHHEAAHAKKHVYDHPRTPATKPQLKLITNPNPIPAKAAKTAAPKATGLGNKTALKTKAKPAAETKTRTTRTVRAKTTVTAKRKSA